MKVYDLRSDTVTQPSPGMRKAIYEAEVGDDVYGDDPTVNELQYKAAGLTGKEASLFLTSGSMGNLIPLIINCGRGNEFLIDSQGHMIHNEMASFTAVAGCSPVPISGKKGILDAEQLEVKLKPDIYYMTRPELIVLENTHNMAGGSCYPAGNLQRIHAFAEQHGLKIHIDGARLFNASIAAGIPAEDICRYSDTITFCLSKGLGAPVGALLCSTKDFIKEARRARKMLGGGMRQAGILAAAGLYALNNNVERLEEDHVNAKRLAECLAETKWAVIDPSEVETNIIYFNTPDKEAVKISKLMKESGILTNSTAMNRIRMVTHLDLTSRDIDEVCKILTNIKMLY